MISGRLQKLSDYKFTLLLVALLAMVLVPLLGEPSPIRSMTYNICSLGVLLFGVLATVKHRRMVAVVLTLGVMTGIAQVGSALHDPRSYAEPKLVLFAAFLAVLVILILRDVLKAEAVTWDKIQGAVCAFLLAGVMWGMLFAWIALNDAEAFSGAVHGTGVGEPMIYYSFITLTTLGYGDIAPASQVARTLSWLEAVFGQIYLTVLVARLVGMHLTAAARGKREAGDSH